MNVYMDFIGAYWSILFGMMKRVLYEKNIYSTFSHSHPYCNYWY